MQDFGHQGNGFWLQGGNVSVTNNIVAGQRGAAYIFFPRGLIQNGLGTTQIPVADLVNPAWAAAGQTMIDVGNVPLARIQRQRGLRQRRRLRIVVHAAGRRRATSPTSAT